MHWGRVRKPTRGGGAPFPLHEADAPTPLPFPFFVFAVRDSASLTLDVVKPGKTLHLLRLRCWAAFGRDQHIAPHRPSCLVLRLILMALALLDVGARRGLAAKPTTKVLRCRKPWRHKRGRFSLSPFAPSPKSAALAQLSSLQLSASRSASSFHRECGRGGWWVWPTSRRPPPRVPQFREQARHDELNQASRKNARTALQVEDAASRARARQGSSSIFTYRVLSAHCNESSHGAGDRKR